MRGDTPRMPIFDAAEFDDHANRDAVTPHDAAISLANEKLAGWQMR